MPKTNQPPNEDTSQSLRHRSGQAVVPAQTIERRILMLRGRKVLIDRDLAELYGVTTKRLNEQVKRNQERFPADFMFPLTEEEKEEVVANCDHLESLKFSATLPSAFTEHGALMAASVLNTPRAIEMSVFVIRAFVRLRQMLASHDELARKVEEMEQKYDKQFAVVFNAIKQLIAEDEEEETRPERRIGFRIREPPVPFRLRFTSRLRDASPRHAP